jgi:hypothetical protein
MFAADKELELIASQVESLENKFLSGSSFGKYLQSEEQASFKRLVAEAIPLLDSVLGEGNNFSRNIAGTVNSGSGGFIGGPSYACVQETRGLIIGAVNHLRRIENLTPRATQTNQSAYVDSGRLAELKALTPSKFDLSRLIRLCEELNMAHSAICLMSIAMLVRAIADHIPPILGQQSFTAVASNYSGAKSFKGSMQRLDTSLRNVADAHLHTQARSRDVLPTFNQVDFRADLDVLLGEIIRTLKT